MTTLTELKQKFDEQIKNAPDLSSIEALRVQFLGKSGYIAEQMKRLAAMHPEERKGFGADVNTLRTYFSEEITNKLVILKGQELESQLANEKIDITLPAREGSERGSIHPISQTIEDIKAIFNKLGFTFIDAQEIEDDWHNFTALNISELHPARQMHDTFYLKDGLLLRTHTSNSQIRYMTGKIPPIKAFTIGKTYRSDYDATHTPMFHQLEIICVDEGIHMGHLKWCIETFLQMFFGIDRVPIRMRPSFFPFTEPSTEVDARCDRSVKGEIKIGQGEDWIELLGSGMVHPKVLQNVGIDSEKYKGFALGAGIERLAMLKYNIPDLRTFFETDLRWLKHYGF